jgi:3-hydroxybutyryl-CoA dehydratase
MVGLTLPLTLRELNLRADFGAIRRYAALTKDANPIHLDAEFASRTRMSGIIAHGTLSLSLIWECLSVSVAPAALKGAELDVSFVRPVRENDLVTAGGELVEAGVYRVWAVTGRVDLGNVVIVGKARLPAAIS